MALGTRKQPPSRPARQMDYTPKPRAVAAGVGLLALALDAEPLVLQQPVATSAAGARHMGRVAALGCALCRRLGFGFTAAEVHHVREGQGGAQRASDFLTVPLCPEHHRGATGFHGLGPRGFERRYGIDELGLLAEVIAELTTRIAA